MSNAPDEQQRPLLDRSGFSIDLDPVEAAQEVSYDQIHEPFDPEKIDVKTKNMTVDLLLARLRRGALHLSPDFQRLAGIWNDTRQSQLIESLLLKIPLPTFYAAELGDDQESWEMVDGIQRLTAIARFIEPGLVGKPPLVLQNLEYLPFDGKTYDDLPGGLKTRLHETEFVVHLIGHGTPDQVKFNIFARINTGGMPLTFQELRHALIPGKARTLLAELAASPEFQEATRGSVSDARMSDREMVLRFLAFRLSDPSQYRGSDLDEFLREAMVDINGLDDETIEALRQDFKHAMRAAQLVFGEHAFRKQSRGQTRRSPINKALFETVSVNLAARSPEQVKILRKNAEQVSLGLAELLEDDGFERAVSVGTGDSSKVRLRFAELDALFRRFEEEVRA